MVESNKAYTNQLLQTARYEGLKGLVNQHSSNPINPESGAEMGDYYSTHIPPGSQPLGWDPYAPTGPGERAIYDWMLDSGIESDVARNSQSRLDFMASQGVTWDDVQIHKSDTGWYGAQIIKDSVSEGMDFSGGQWGSGLINYATNQVVNQTQRETLYEGTIANPNWQAPTDMDPLQRAAFEMYRNAGIGAEFYRADATGDAWWSEDNRDDVSSGWEIKDGEWGPKVSINTGYLANRTPGWGEALTNAYGPEEYPEHAGDYMPTGWKQFTWTPEQAEQQWIDYQDIQEETEQETAAIRRRDSLFALSINPNTSLLG